MLRQGNTNLNLAEKARAGYWGWVASLRLKDSTRMKLEASVNLDLSSRAKLHVLLVAVRSDSWVRGELDACGGGHINASSNELETGLQKRSAQVKNGWL